MSFMDHIEACNAHELGNFLPFVVSGERVGWIKKDVAPMLGDYPDVFDMESVQDGVTLVPELDDYDNRTAAVGDALRDLSRAGVITGWRDEAYVVGTSFTGPHLFEMERAAVPLFGVRAYGVHINGFVRDGERLLMWIGRRAEDRPVCPGQLDNMIAGGQPAGLGLMENVIKEAQEEASVPRELAERAIPVGAISYVMETETGLKPDVMFCYDLELPGGFTPHNTDGEISSFQLLPAENVADIMETGFDFKFNCNLVNLDFLIRHGVIAPEYPGYLEIVHGLHR